MADLTTVRLNDLDEKDYMKNPMDYYTAKFCSFLVQKKKLCLKKIPETEKPQLEQSIQKLKEFEEYDVFLEYVKSVHHLVYNMR